MVTESYLIFSRTCTFIVLIIGIAVYIHMRLNKSFIKKTSEENVDGQLVELVDFDITSKMRHLEQQIKGVKSLFDINFYSDDFKIKIFGEEQEFSIFDLVDTFYTLICATNQFIINDLSQENIATAQKVTAIAQTTVELLTKEVERPSTLFSKEYYQQLAEELAKTNDYLMDILKPMEMTMLGDYRKQMSEITDENV